MKLTQTEELRAIQAVLAGDTDRFEDLVRAYESGIYRLCLRMLGNEQDALDASQEAFFKAYRGLSGYRGDSRFSTWLYRLASNVCMDMLRRRPAAPDLSAEDDWFAALPDDRTPSPQEALEKKELRAAVAEAMAALQPEFRQAVVLRDVNGLTYDEIAAVTGLGAGTVKSRIFRARRKLADALMEDGNFSALHPSKKTDIRSVKGGDDA